jgi:hypothetical protein
MLYRKIIAVCSESYTEHMNKLFGHAIIDNFHAL